MPPGRVTKLTPAIQTAIANAVTAGVPLITAAELVGIEPTTVKEWMARGLGTNPTRPRRPLYASFAAAIIHARAADEARRVARIEAAARGGAVIYRRTVTNERGQTTIEERLQPPDWQADKWHLECSRSDAWGRKDKLDVTVTIQQLAVQVAAELGLTPEEVLEEAQLLLAAPRPLSAG